MTAELLMENETFMVCIVLSRAFQVSAENSADYKADGMYVDPADIWDTRWMGKVKVGDW